MWDAIGAMARAIRAAGTVMHVWTINDPDEMTRLKEEGPSDEELERVPALLGNAQPLHADEVEESVGEVKMDEGDADSMADVFVDCMDAEKLIEEQFSSMASQMTDEQKECINDVLDEEKVKEIMSLAFQGDTAAMGSLMQEDMMECIQG